ncbi:MAG: hypothetical protein ACREP7_01255 [Lysobacter sp.]
MREIDGEFYVMSNWNGLKPLAESYETLFVHPGNGCLMRNEGGIRYRRERLRVHRLAVRERQAGWQAEVRKLDERKQLRRIGGIWYEIELAPVPLRAEPRKPDQRRRSLPIAEVFDAISHKKVGSCNGERCRMYGACALYARSKRQLSRTELTEYRLQNGTAPDSYAMSLSSGASTRVANKHRATARSGARNKDH